MLKLFFSFMSVGLTCYGQGINTKVITPFTPVRIVLSQTAITTLVFPQQYSGVYGLGIVKDGKTKGTVQGTDFADQPILILRAITTDNTQMTVSMGGQ